MIILFKLIIAHILTDFIIQPSSWVKDKRSNKHKSPFLYLHVLLTGLAVYFFIGAATQWQIPLFIAITHYFIDLWKLQKEDNLIYFLLDQLFHLIIILISTLFLTQGFQYSWEWIIKILNNETVLVLTLAYMFIIWPAGYIIGKATIRWRMEIEALTPEKDSLSQAGKWIGIFERLLVLTFVLANQYPAIGFLIAAKSILRFGDKNTVVQRKQTEYVLVGTLLSFTIAIFIGLATAAGLRH